MRLESAKPRLRELGTKIRKQLQQLSARERALVLVVIIGALPYLFDRLILTPMNEKFELQDLELQQVTSHSTAIPVVLSDYLKLKARRDQIESKYEQIDPQSVGLSALENLVKEKAGVTSGFTIDPRAPQSFGANYQQTPYSVKFYTTNYEKLVDFLKEMDYDSKAFVLTRLNVKKSPAADRLEVNMDLSGIAKSR